MLQILAYPDPPVKWPLKRRDNTSVYEPIVAESVNWSRWSDRSRNTKLVLLVANLPQIGGCLMYFVGISPWMLVAGRFVAGT